MVTSITVLHIYDVFEEHIVDVLLKAALSMETIDIAASAAILIAAGN